MGNTGGETGDELPSQRGLMKTDKLNDRILRCHSSSFLRAAFAKDNDDIFDCNRSVHGQHETGCHTLLHTSGTSKFFFSVKRVAKSNLRPVYELDCSLKQHGPEKHKGSL